MTRDADARRELTCVHFLSLTWFQPRSTFFFKNALLLSPFLNSSTKLFTKSNFYLTAVNPLRRECHAPEEAAPGSSSVWPCDGDTVSRSAWHHPWKERIHWDHSGDDRRRTDALCVVRIQKTHVYEWIDGWMDMWMDGWAVESERVRSRRKRMSRLDLLSVHTSSKNAPERGSFKPRAPLTSINDLARTSNQIQRRNPFSGDDFQIKT